MASKLVGAAVLALAVAACGTNSSERTTGGAAAGAATGAGVGALGGPVGALAGAAIGGGVGAVTGATTSPSTLNLGEPPWSNPEVRTPLDDRGGRSARRGRDRQATREARAERDRAYMGGGMVGTPGGTSATAPAASATGGTTTGSAGPR